MLAASSELPESGDFKTIEAVGKQILITRTKEGVKAFFNMCSHRGPGLCRTLVDQLMIHLSLPCMDVQSNWGASGHLFGERVWGSK